MHSIPLPTATDSRPAYGLFSQLEGRRVPLPLKAVDVRFEVAGDCAQVTLEQIFEFDGPNPVDVIYTFPLPADASVHNCEMRVGDRRVVAVAKPVAQARADAAAAKAKGHRTALVESVRDNLFELQLGNVQPGDAITLRIAYLNPVLGDGPDRRLRIPICPGVRYVPGLPVGADGGTDLVPDAGRLNPPRIDGRDPEAAAFFCAGTLAGAARIRSATHHIEVRPAADDGKIPILLAADGEIPDRDFILTWDAAEDVLALTSAADPDYLLCSVRVPGDLPSARGARDVFFLLDASGSMEGINWQALVEAVKIALDQLADTDRVQVILFSNRVWLLTSQLEPVNPATVRRIVTELANHRPDGGTEFTAAFGQTITAAGKARRPVIVTLTDGQFGDEQRSCELAATCGIEVHTIGIDANVNESALRKIARRTRGTCTLCDPREDLGGVIQNLIAGLLAPGIERVTAAGWMPVGNPPALRAGQAGLIPFRRDGAGDEPVGEIDLSLGFSDGSTRQLRLPVRTTAGRSPGLFAAKAEINALADANRPREATLLACRHNLLCEGVAFVAIDESSKVPVATVTLEQPSPEPDEGDFGCRVSSPLMGPYRIRKSSIVDYDIADDQDSSPRRSYGGSLFKGFIGSPPRYPKETEEELFARAATAACFAGHPEWPRLLTTVLLPWAQANPDEAFLLHIWLEKLMAFPGGSAGASQAATMTVETTLPQLPVEIAGALMDFFRHIRAL